MKKQIVMLIILGVGMLILQGCIPNPDVGHLVISGGRGGPSDASSVSFELGGVDRSYSTSGRDTMLSLGIPIIFNGGDADYDESTSGDYSYLYNWERRIGTLQDTGTYRDWPEFGFFLKYGIEIIPDTNLFITGFGGCTFADEVTVYESEIRVYPYSYGKDEGWTTYGLFGGGLTYIADGLIFQFDYDNRRGISAGMGWKF